MTTFRNFFFAALVVLSAPVEALACAVCGMGGPGNNATAYFAMTMALSTLPVAMVGGVVYWAYRRSADADADDTNAPR